MDKTMEASIQRYAKFLQIPMAGPQADFTFRQHPIVVTPADILVQQAVNEMGPALKDVDVIQLEPICQGDRLAWVTNEDYFGGMGGKKRVIHLCMKKIMDRFKQAVGGKGLYDPAKAQHNQEMKDIVKLFLQKVVLPHEAEHIHQEMQHGGQFGPSPEMGAHRVEQWNEFKQYGMKPKYAQATGQESPLPVTGDISVDSGNNLWMKKGDDYVLLLGRYFFDKHGEGKKVAGGTVKGWRSIKDIYDFFHRIPLTLKQGFQTVRVEGGGNMDTVAELSPEEVSRLRPENLGVFSKNNFELPNMEPNTAPILRANHPKGKSTPAVEFQVLMLPTSSKDLEEDPDMAQGYDEAKSTARQLEAAGKKLWVIVTTYPGKSVAPGDLPGKEQWLHPDGKGGIEGRFAFTEDSVTGALEPWHQAPLNVPAQPATTASPTLKTAKILTSMLDKIADRLESKGFIKEAIEIDSITNAVEKLL